MTNVNSDMFRTELEFYDKKIIDRDFDKDLSDRENRLVRVNINREERDMIIKATRSMYDTYDNVDVSVEFFDGKHITVPIKAISSIFLSLNYNIRICCDDIDYFQKIFPKEKKYEFYPDKYDIATYECQKKCYDGAISIIPNMFHFYNTTYRDDTISYMLIKQYSYITQEYYYLYYSSHNKKMNIIKKHDNY